MTWAKCGHVGLIDGFNRCHHWRFVESRMYLQSKCNGYEWKGPMGSRYDGVCLRQPDVGRIPWAGIPILP